MNKNFVQPEVKWYQRETHIQELWDHDLSWSRMLNWLSHPGALKQSSVFLKNWALKWSFLYLPSLLPFLLVFSFCWIWVSLWYHFIYDCRGAPGWPSGLSIQLLVWAQVMISWFVTLRPASGCALTARSLLGILSLTLSLCSSPACSLSPSQNK